MTLCNSKHYYLSFSFRLVVVEGPKVSVSWNAVGDPVEHNDGLRIKLSHAKVDIRQQDS